jgi:membrane-associated phospholipid phosphatase
MGVFDFFLLLAITIVLIIGGYQFYFWAQRQNWFPARRLETRFDSMITYDPRWVWVYSGLYYPMIVLAAFSMPSYEAYAYSIGAFLLLLFIQCLFFLFIPFEIPPEWRTKWIGPWEGTISQKFLNVVWSYDKLRNSMPSMHVSVAMMVDLTIGLHWPAFTIFGLAFPILIAISAVKTKQHYVVDVIPGAVLGASVFYFWHWLV